MFHFIQLYVRFGGGGGWGRKGLRKKNGFDGVIKLLVYARGEQCSFKPVSKIYDYVCVFYSVDGSRKRVHFASF